MCQRGVPAPPPPPSMVTATDPGAVAVAFGTCEAPFQGNAGIIRNMAWGVLEGPAHREALEAILDVFVERSLALRGVKRSG